MVPFTPSRDDKDMVPFSPSRDDKDMVPFSPSRDDKDMVPFSPSRDDKDMVPFSPSRDDKDMVPFSPSRDDKDMVPFSPSRDDKDMVPFSPTILQSLILCYKENNLRLRKLNLLQTKNINTAQTIGGWKTFYERTKLSAFSTIYSEVCRFRDAKTEIIWYRANLSTL